MIYNNYPDDYIVINAKWVEWDNDEQRWFFMTEDAFEKAQSLADYTKQVRKEVCEEIRKWCDKNFNWVGDGTGCDGQDYSEMIGSNNTINKLRELLDQIQGK